MSNLLERCDARLSLIDSLLGRVTIFFAGNFLAFLLFKLVDLRPWDYGNFLIGLGVLQVTSIMLWPLGVVAVTWWFVAVVLTRSKQTIAWLTMVAVMLFSLCLESVVEGGWMILIFVAEFILIAAAIYWLRNRRKR